MEYNRTDNLTIPVRIFDMGLERFATEVDYVLRYLGWLLSIKDEKSEIDCRYVAIIHAEHSMQTPVSYLSVSLVHSLQRKHVRFGSGGLDMNTSTEIFKQRINWKKGWQKFIQVVRIVSALFLSNPNNTIT